jgi:hypothetical protein
LKIVIEGADKTVERYYLKIHLKKYQDLLAETGKMQFDLHKTDNLPPDK